MKKFKELGKMLSKGEQKKIRGGEEDLGGDGCLELAKKCSANNDCCSKWCVAAGDNDPQKYCIAVP